MLSAALNERSRGVPAGRPASRPGGDAGHEAADAYLDLAPNGWVGDPEEEASYHCDLWRVENWRDHFLPGPTHSTVGDDTLMARVAGHVGTIPHSDVEGVVYLDVDRLGRALRERVANEACRHVANAAGDLPEGHRLPPGCQTASNIDSLHFRC